MDTTYDARIYETRVYKGKKVTTYTVRWKVDGKEWTEPFRNSTQAGSFRSKLVTAAKDGEAFSIATGHPVSWHREKPKPEQPSMSWYAFACAYTDMKWKDASGKYRYDIARALTAASPAMFKAGATGKPADADIRRALLRWGFNPKQRGDASDDVAVVLEWVKDNTEPVSALASSAATRRILDTATTNLDGKRCAATTCPFTGCRELESADGRQWR